MIERLTRVTIETWHIALEMAPYIVLVAGGLCQSEQLLTHSHLR